MIHVQIASQVNVLGVDQVRWVLVEPAEQAWSPASPAAPAQALAPFVDRLPGEGWTLTLLKGAVILAGLLVALLAARHEFGPPTTLPGWLPRPELAPAQPPAAPTPHLPARPASAVAPVAQQA